MIWISILNVISTIAATAAAWGSYLATKEATKAQKASFTPVIKPIGFWVKKSTRNISVRLEIGVENIGQFIAQSISITIKAVGSKLASFSVDNLEPGGKSRYYDISFEKDFDIVEDFLSKKDNRVIIEYSDIFGNKLSTICLLEFDRDWGEARSNFNENNDIKVNIKDWFFQYEITNENYITSYF